MYNFKTILKRGVRHKTQKALGRKTGTPLRQGFFFLFKFSLRQVLRLSRNRPSNNNHIVHPAPLAFTHTPRHLTRVQQRPREGGAAGPVRTTPLVFHPHSLTRPQPRHDVGAAHIVVSPHVRRDGQRRPHAVHHHVGPHTAAVGAAVGGGHDVEVELVHSRHRRREHPRGGVVAVSCRMSRLCLM